MRAWAMALAAIGGLYGAAGVALSAAAAHRGGGALATTAADLLLFHATAIVALCVAPRTRLLLMAATLLALGAAGFSGELALHALAGLQPLPMAAPVGGTVLILGWLVAAVALPLALARRD